MNWQLIVAGFVVHLVFFYSIFDIYFTSPLVHGMSPHSTTLSPPAKRLVLFVADGLRADTLFELDEQGETRSPYLRNIMLNEGTWGVSHTRVPTESRPGHVALIAGFYEDVSAVAKGWKENPVEFDSVFNQSRYTWSWGSPDILPMFAKGATGDHVFMKTYPAESEDFAGSDLSKLDTWVFDEVQTFLQEAKKNQTVTAQLNSNKIVLFLHLLGIDTNGHAHKPYSEEYKENVKIVDRGVEETVQLIEEFFDNDGKTAYVYTADHGMTNWGSHGAGHPQETLTPLVVWGAGVNKAQAGTPDDYEDGFQIGWKLSHTKRCDVNQADIAPLMASLIGVPFPLNSVGVLPLDYLDNSHQYKAESLLTNALQLVSQYEIKESHMKDTTLSVFFTPFTSLLPSERSNFFRKIRDLINKQEYQSAILLTKQLMDYALDGLNYYQKYDRFFLGTSIVLGYFGWMAYILQILLRSHTSITSHRPKCLNIDNSGCANTQNINIIFTIIGGTVFILLTLQRSPAMYYIYCLLPVVLWNHAAKQYHVISDVISYISKNLWGFKLIGCGFLMAAAVEILVLSFFHRELLSVGLLGIGVFPMLTSLRKSDKVTVFCWLIICIIVAVFPLLPVVGRESDINLVLLAGILAFLSSLCLVILTSPSDSTHKMIAGAQIIIICVAMVVVYTTSVSISNKQGVHWFSQVVSWSILFASFIIPSLTPRLILSRLFNSALALGAPFLLMCIAHEGLFFVALCYLMFFWLLVEHKLAKGSMNKLYAMSFDEVHIIEESNPRHLDLADARRAFFFVFFTVTGFFGTGNIASINSFEISSVYCFLTVFNPFVMGTLFLTKIMVPIIMVTCTFQAIHVTQQVPTKSLFLIVLLMSDLMAVQFFFLVRDTGSWLEIGTSISHYVIVMCMILFMTLLLVVAKLFTTATLPGIVRISRKKHIH
ncbi:GPI ethanolamine phosphate transferase 1-like [Ptychodera flava]|uniref:GPI ethanolamine phosphate transferase 1-like n=1 Tax=Ptychodera flava TaxID=63121 RepID=UPI00396AA5FA